MIKNIGNIFHPERFQGSNKTKAYFEGWYFKIINADETAAFAIIPGIAMDQNGNKHAFIQVLNGKNKQADYHKFDFETFSFNPNKFEIRIGNNYFSNDNISLDINNLQGKLKFANLKPWPDSFLSPGIMGPFTFVPFMECYHGVMSMDHQVEGSLLIDNQKVDFSKGKGYIEKDWGTSFPGAYIWMQANHFSKPGISLKVSVAKIPWLGNSFTGFIGGLLLNDEIIRFTTYNSSKLTKSFADKETVLIHMENRDYQLKIKANRDHATELASPIGGLMDGRISESMTSTIEVELIEKRSKCILLSDTSRNAALEVAGKISEIMG